MSFLLDALKKTEERQHRGEIPTIHSPAAVSNSRYRVMLPWLLLAIVLIVVGGWVAWNLRTVQDETGAASPQSAGTLPSPRESRSAAGTPRAERPPFPEADQASGENAVVAVDTSDDKPRRERTPVERFEPAADVQPEIASRPSVGFAGDEDAGDLDSHRVEETRDVDGLASTRTIPPPAETVSVTPAKEPQARAPAPHRSEPIAFWELPSRIRDNLPGLQISVLVYAENPASRFVLINGDRVREGDTLDSGPTVEEIRRDGVVFRYELYRFLLRP